MTKSILELQKFKFGEQILVMNEVVRFGTRPGWLDKFLGEKDVRKIIIGDRNIDQDGAEYQQLCEAMVREGIRKRSECSVTRACVGWCTVVVWRKCVVLIG